MARVSPILTNSTGGEVSPLLAGQVNLKKYGNFHETFTNFLIRTQGPASRRPGTEFIAETRYSLLPSRLVGFEFSNEQAYMLEFGDNYIRFYYAGIKAQIVTAPATPYQISTTYAATELPELKFIQSADTLYICHPDHPTRKLTRTGHTSWTLTDIDFVDGPYFPENTSDTTIQPSGTTGNVTLTAVPAPGPEQVHNGEFTPDLGAELVSNGNFRGIFPWVLGANWSLGTIGCIHTPGEIETLSQPITIIATSVYQVIFTISGYVAGDVTPFVGNTAGTLRSGDGTYTEFITAANTDGIVFTPSITFSGELSNVSVRKFTTETQWTWGANWTHDLANFQADHATGEIEPLEQDVTVSAGKIYTVVFTVSNRTTGNVTPYLGSTTGTPRSTNAIFTEDITATDDGNLQFVPDTDFNGSIDTVSVKESSLSVEVFNVGHIGSLWRLKHSTTWGYAKVTAFINKTQVTVLVKKDFGGVGAVKEWREGAWSSYRGYPSALSFYEERLLFAGTKYQPQSIWGSVSADFENFTPESTITDSGPFTYTLASNQINIIYWLSPARVLMAGTAGGEFKISASTVNAGITPTDIAAKADTAYGSANIQPLSIGEVVLFVQGHGRKIRELVYSFEKDGYVAPDMNRLAEHITKSGIKELAYQKEPDQTVWAVRNDGHLVSMLYQRDEDIVGWSEHTTDGTFESVACIPGTNQTEVWIIVNRTIGVDTKRYIECFKDIDWGDDQEDCYFVDCGLTYDDVPITTITSGLDHLEGKTVQVLADGAVRSNCVVTGGSITLASPATAASVIHVGLPYTSTLKTMRLEIMSQEGTAQSKLKRIHQVAVRLYKTLGCKIGPNADNLETIYFRIPGHPMGSPSPLFSGDKVVDFRGDYEMEGQILIIQDQPLPLTIVAIMPRLTTFDG